MIKIEAIIRPEKVNVVISALEEVGCVGLNMVNITGRGQQKGVQVFTHRGAETVTRSMLPKTILTTVVPDDQKDVVVDTIVRAARTGEAGAIGDGKIFISPVSEVVRVRTGERDEAALL
ncbi:MAG: P-II family nitrogen regulator [Dehalococcoidia bacterium]